MGTNAIGSALGLFVITATQDIAATATVLRNVAVVDGTGKAAQNNQDVVITGDRILAIRPAGSSVP